MRFVYDRDNQLARRERADDTKLSEVDPLVFAAFVRSSLCSVASGL
jgi:hypothetical protein